MIFGLIKLRCRHNAGKQLLFVLNIVLRSTSSGNASWTVRYRPGRADVKASMACVLNL